MTWQIDQQSSKLEFSVKHMMIATVRGTFEQFTAELDINPDDLTQSRVTAQIDTASVTTKDRMRDEYLVGKDFFNPAEFPHILYESTGVRLRGKKITVTGKLKIRDKERSLILEGSVKGPGSGFGGGPRRLAFDLTGVIERESFGLVFNGAVETVSVVVGKKVPLKLSINLVEEK